MLLKGSLREKCLVIAAVMACLYFVFDYGFGVHHINTQKPISRPANQPVGGGEGHEKFVQSIHPHPVTVITAENAGQKLSGTSLALKREKFMAAIIEDAEALHILEIDERYDDRITETGERYYWVFLRVKGERDHIVHYIEALEAYTVPLFFDTVKITRMDGEATLAAPVMLDLRVKLSIKDLFSISLVPEAV